MRPGLVLLALVAWAPNAGAQAPGAGDLAWRIRHHEPVAVRPQGPEADRRRSAAPASLDFDAFGRRFELRIEPNEALLGGLAADRRARIGDQVRVYRGSIRGVRDSWVRLTEESGHWSGALWDGEELYLLDPLDAVRPRLMEAPDEGASNVVYRLADVEGLEADGCGLVDPFQAGAPPGAGQWGESLAAALAPLSSLALTIVADSQMVAANGDATAAAVLGRVNVVDGIFSAQVGVTLNVVELLELQSNGSLTATDATDLLYEFASLSRSGAIPNPGHAHLFTGRDLDERTIGIAFLGGVCSSYFGVGLSQTGGQGTAGALTVAHEMGHNLGAPHDNQAGSPCEATSDQFLMNPRLNGSDTFSACSLARMDPVVAGARCLDPVASADLDGDGVPDAQDLCPAFADDQADTNGDGRGDACECGDQTGDGHVDLEDVLAINTVLHGAAEAAPLCDANDDGQCNILDILAVNAKIFGVQTYCERYPIAGGG